MEELDSGSARALIGVRAPPRKLGYPNAVADPAGLEKGGREAAFRSTSRRRLLAVD
jgi:hypothetical protein